MSIEKNWIDCPEQLKKDAGRNGKKGRFQKVNRMLDIYFRGDININQNKITKYPSKKWKKIKKNYLKVQCIRAAHRARVLSKVGYEHFKK